MNRKLGLKYYDDCKLVVIHKPRETECQLVVWSLSANKIVDKFRPLNKNIVKAGGPNFNLFVKSFDKNDQLRPILQKDFCNLYGTSEAQNKKIKQTLNSKGNSWFEVLPSRSVIDYLKQIIGTEGNNLMHEKHLGIILAYGFNLTLTRAKQLINH